MEIIYVNILNIFAQLLGGKTTGRSESLFILYFPAQCFEFSFNPGAKLNGHRGTWTGGFRQLNLICIWDSWKN